MVQSLASNHGFIDGNKRTALLMMNLLILQSDYKLRGDSEQQVNADVEDMILALVEHRIGFDEAVAWLERRIIRASGT
ncbi:MAG: Fic family protein [Xanthobacteraceae bacterium]